LNLRSPKQGLVIPPLVKVLPDKHDSVPGLKTREKEIGFAIKKFSFLEDSSETLFRLVFGNKKRKKSCVSE
jgi:hypothetical protein